MDKVKLIANLCGIIDAQNGIIYAQAMELIQMGGEPHVAEIVEQRQAYADTMGERGKGL
ncbi:MAG: hypothetical protein RR949_04270 [Oscillospiraceae bacterium]